MMKKLIYYFFRLNIFINKLIPFWILYRLSDILYLLFYYVFKYRKTIVIENLKRCFPEKPDEEIIEMSKKFFRNFADIFMESSKGFSMNVYKLIERYKIQNPELLNKYYEQGRDVIVVGSHYTNWEWGVQCVGMQVKHYTVGLYKPLSNKIIDKWLRRTRAQWGVHLASIHRTTLTFDEKRDKPAGFVMLADQTPHKLHNAYWIDFLGQDTPCLHGPEKHAKRRDLPVIFCDVQRVKRGYYTVVLSLLEDNPGQTADGEITKKYMRTLEKIILKKPENWLWSHRRWKRANRKK